MAQTPVISTVSPDSNVAGDRITNRNVLTLNGTGVANSTINVFDGTVLLGTATVNSSGAWTFATIALADGAHSFTATDTAGGSTSAASAPLAVTVDTHAPNAPVIVSDVTDSARQEVLTGTAEANSTVKIYDGATLLGTTTANASGTWNFTTTAMTANGGGTGVTSDSLTATATDVAGNVSASSAASNVITVAGWWATADSHGANPTGPWWVENNIWGVNTNTTSFTQTITLHSGTFPDNVTMTWSYPEIFAPSGKYSYPEIVYGATPYTLPAVSVPGGSTQLANLTNLTSTYDVTLGGEVHNYDVIWDVWFTGTPNGGAADRLFEVMIMPHTDWPGGTLWIPSGSFTKIFSGTDSAFGAYNVYTVNYGWTGVIVQPVGAVDKLSGTIDIGSIIKGMIWNGIVTGNEYVSGIEFGPEVDQGSGSMTVNALDYTWASKANTTGTAGSDTFNITTPGGNHIVGNGGTDTVVYFSTYAQSQLKTSGSNLLVMQTGNYNTLDDLQGISFVKFADGTYNVSTHTFTQGVGTSGAPVILGITPDSGTAGDGITNATVLTLSGLAPANSTVKVYDGATLLGSVTANASGSWSYATGTLANGAHNFTATDTVSGTTSPASPVLSVTVDTVTPAKPAITGFSPDTGTVGDGVTTANALTLSGTAEANSTVKVYDGGALLGTATANAGGAWSYTTPGLASTTHSFTATATDAAGNASGTSSALSVTVNAPPNLIVNGSFETGDFSGWTMGANYGPNQWGPGTSIDANAHSGTYAANLGPVGSDGTMSEVVQTTAGAHYTLDFWLANSGGGPDDFAVKWNGQSLVSLVNTAAQGYTEYTYDVVGTAGTSTLEFDFRQDPSHWSLDAISLSPVGGQAPPPPPPPPSAPAITAYSTDTGVVGDAVTSDATLTLTGTAAANSTVTFYDGATQIGTTTANASGAWSYTTAALANATHSLTATATVSGATSAASTALSVTVDTVAPNAATIASFSTDSGVAGDGITNDNTLTLTGTAEANSTVTVFDGATQLGTATANGSGAWSYTTGALSNAAHSFTAKATDAAGNTGAASSALAVTVDTAAPVAPAIASYSTDTGVAGDGITSDNTLTLTGTAEANSTVTVFDGATQLGTATANGSGAWSYTTGALSNAAHSFTAKATDAAGNTGAASSALNVTVDTAAPNAPTVAAFSPDTGTVGDGITTANVVTLTGAAEANSTVKVFDGGALLGTTIANGSGAWSFTTAALSVATHGFTATATDAAGNVSATSAALNVTVSASVVNAPAITSFSPDSGTVGDGMTNASSVTLTGTAVANSTVTVFDGGTQIGTATANSSGAWSYSTAALSNGTHNFTATDTVSGNTSGASAALNVTIDTLAPAQATIATFSTDSGVTGDGITSDNTLTLTGTAEANSTVKVFDGATQIGTVTANGSGAWSYTTGVLSNAAHNFTATATDAAGNTSTPSSALAVTVDAQAPGAPAIASYSSDTGVGGDGITSDNTLTLTGVAEANSTVKVFDGATLLGTAVANGSGAWTYATGTLSDGAHNLTATATDVAGNVSVASAALSVIVDTAAPTAPAFTGYGPDSPTVLTLNGTAEANSTIEVYDVTVSLANPIGSATTNSSGVWSFVTPQLSNGSHDFVATATDAAGNTSAVSEQLDPVIPADMLQNLVANGSFETGNFTGWTLGGNSGIGPYGAQTFTVGNAEDGLSAAGLGSIGSDGTLSQTLQTTAGQHYTLDFWLADLPASWAGSNGTTVPNDFTVTWNGVKLLGMVNAAAQGYTEYTFDVIGTAGTSHLEFDFRNDPSEWNLDNVSVTAADAPPAHAPISVAISNFALNSKGVALLSGTSEANSTVSIFDGSSGKSLGTVTAGADGTWNLTMKNVANTVHSYTATASDAGGDSGATPGLAIFGTTGNNTLTGGSSNDQFSGRGGIDTFVFSGHFGNDTIKDFVPGGSSHDVIQLSLSTFSNYAAVMAHTAQVGANVVITVDPTDTITLNNTTLANLHSYDFHLV